MITRRDVLRTGAAATMTTMSGVQAFAQETYPAREIRVLCPFPPASGADIVARFYAAQLQKLCGKTVLIENKVGAFGNIATEALARSKPDGYTIFIAPGSSMFAAAANLFKKLPFDPVKDFEHVTTLLRLAFLLIVNGDSPHKTVAELTDYLKKQGDKASYASVANISLVGSELYKAQFGLQTVEVKYKDSSAMLTDLWGGNLAFAHFDPAQAAAHLKSGKIRALATTAADPMVSLPGIPSAKQAGILNSDLTAWFSVHAPAKTPKPVVDQLEKWFNQIVASDEAKKFCADMLMDPFPGSQKSVNELLVKEIKNWEGYVKLAKIEQT